MLLQNAQMHQVIMQNLMLQALPPAAPVSSRGPQATLLHPTPQVGSAWSRHWAKEATQVNTWAASLLESCASKSEKHIFGSGGQWCRCEATHFSPAPTPMRNGLHCLEPRKLPP